MSRTEKKEDEGVAGKINITHPEESHKFQRNLISAPNLPPNEDKPAGKKEDTKKLIITILAIVGFFGFLLFLFLYLKGNYTPQYETYTSEKNFVFTKKAGLWHTEWQEEDKLYNIHFHFNPEEADSVPLIDNSFDLEEFNKGPIYLTFDPADYGLSYVTVAASELSLNLARALHVDVIGACTENATGCYNSPIRDCSSDASVVYLKETDETSIVLQGTCIIIQGRESELIRAVDKLLFIWYKIV